MFVIARSPRDEAIQTLLADSGLPRRFAKAKAARQLSLTSQGQGGAVQLIRTKKPALRTARAMLF
jgi:hypothetical protein